MLELAGLWSWRGPRGYCRRRKPSCRKRSDLSPAIDADAVVTRCESSNEIAADGFVCFTHARV